MPLTTEEINRIAVEVDLGIAPEDSTVPASPEADEARAALEKDIAEIKARGGSVKHYDEFPKLDDNPPNEY